MALPEETRDSSSTSSSRTTPRSRAALHPGAASLPGRAGRLDLARDPSRTAPSTSISSLSRSTASRPSIPMFQALRPIGRHVVSDLPQHLVRPARSGRHRATSVCKEAGGNRGSARARATAEFFGRDLLECQGACTNAAPMMVVDGTSTTRDLDAAKVDEIVERDPGRPGVREPRDLPARTTPRSNARTTLEVYQGPRRLRNPGEAC